MAGSKTTQRFTFTNRAEDLYSLILHITNFVTEEQGPNSFTEFKLKIILTELLTNSIKHTGQGITTLEVALSDQYIRIDKIDNGSPLRIDTPTKIVTWPLTPESLAGDVLNIYGDDTCTLKGELLDNHSLRFFIEEKQPEYYSDDVKLNLLEHLGLLIITRAADQFSYSFNAESGGNVFSIVIFTTNTK